MTNTLRLYASDPLYPEWDALLTLYAQELNPQCWFDLAGCSGAEYEADVTRLEAEIVERFEELTR